MPNDPLTPEQCLCTGHSSEMSTSGWSPHPDCPIHSRTSNVQSLLEDLRNDDCLSMQHTAWLEGRAVTEIERLTRERDEARSQRDGAYQASCAMNSRFGDRFTVIEAERDRLRAALERIKVRVEAVPINQRENDEIAVLEIAEDALFGEQSSAEPSADETFCDCPPNCLGPDHTTKLCRAESSEKAKGDEA